MNCGYCKKNLLNSGMCKGSQGGGNEVCSRFVDVRLPEICYEKHFEGKKLKRVDENLSKYHQL